MATKVVSNCSYNVTKQLAKKLNLVWNLDKWIADAKKDGHTGCVKMWEEIKKDEIKHAKMLQGVVEGKSKKGGLK